MRTVLTKLILCLALVAFSNLGQAATYYFSSSSGDDSRSASQAQNSSTPWRTINKLNAIFSTLKPGDRVLFKRGDTFYGTIEISESGSPGNPIVISAYDSGPLPVITSLVTLTDWRSVGNGVYESQNASLSTDAKILLWNDKIQEIGRYPNSDAKNGGYLTISGSSGNRSVSSSELSSSPNFSGGEVVIRKNQWIIDRHPISSHSGNTVNYNGTGVYSPSVGYGFFIQNHINTLDQAGEWYFNKSAKKISLHFGSNSPSSSRVQVSTLDHLLTKSYQASHIRVESLHFKGANKDGIYLAGGRDIQLQNIVVENSGENGFTALSILELVVNNSRFVNSLNNGLNLRYGDDGAKITNNVIENTFIFQGGVQNGDRNGVGILVTSDHSVIEHNKIINTGFNGIDFSGNNILIKNNLIDGFSYLKNDAGGIYSFGGTSTTQSYKDRKLVGNIILNGRGTRDGTPPVAYTSKAQSSGIFLDDNSNGIEITDNTVASNELSGLKIGNGNNIIVKNNTFFDSNYQVFIANIGRGRNTRGLEFSDNIYFSKEADQTSYTFVTDFDDISSMGRFDQNYFARPMGDPHSISVRYKKSNKMVDDVLNLERWQRIFGLDKSSKNQNQSLKTFSVKSLLGENLVGNGSFLSNILGMFCGDCKPSRVTDIFKLGALKVESPGQSELRTGINKVEKDKTYVLKFKARSNKPQGLRVFLRIGGHPWHVVSPSTTVQLTDKEQEYTVLLKPYQDVDKTTVMFVSDEGGWTYWMDDLEIKEAEVDIVDPSEKILFEYNATKSEKTISLNGTYVDAQNRTYSGSVKLAPYSSIVLVNTSGTNSTPPSDAPRVSLTSPGNNHELEKGTQVVIKADASANGRKIEKVEFFNGDKILGTSTEAPFSYTWQNVPEGSHTLKAVATCEKNMKSTSQEVRLKVVATSVDKSPQDGFAPLFVNAGGDAEISYGGSTFVPLSKTQVKADNYTRSTHATPQANMLFQSSTFARNLSYAIPVPNGTYTVKTYHSEGYFGVDGPAASKGQRIFDILVEGQLVKKDFDLYAEYGNKEAVLTFQNIEVKDGVLNLDMPASANNAVLSGFAVIPFGMEKTLPGATQKGTLFIKTGSHEDVTYQNQIYVSEVKSNFLSRNPKSYENPASSSEPLFQSHRFARDLNYTIPVPNGRYTVITYHHESYFGYDGPSAAKGRRVFDIYLEEKLVKSNLDLYAENGNKPLALRFDNIEVSDGTINLDMFASMNNAMISGIAIISEADKASVLGSANLRVMAAVEPEPEEDGADELINNSVAETGTGFQLYPNPARDYATLSVNKELGRFSILVHNTNGQLIDHHDPEALLSDRGTYRIPVHHLQHGIYIITLAGDKEIEKRFRLVVAP